MTPALKEGEYLVFFTSSAILRSPTFNLKTLTPCCENFLQIRHHLSVCSLKQKQARLEHPLKFPPKNRHCSDSCSEASIKRTDGRSKNVLMRRNLKCAAHAVTHHQLIFLRGILNFFQISANFQSNHVSGVDGFRTKTSKGAIYFDALPSAVLMDK